MTLKTQIGKLYWWFLRTFIYNDFISDIFFKKGIQKRINGHDIILPFKYSWFYPSNYEQEKSNFISEHCTIGDTVIDIGAHLGIFTYFLAKQVGPTGKVYSFEPAENTFDQLRKTIKYNQLESFVIANQQAVSNHSGQVEFFIYSNSKISNANSISAQNTDSSTKRTFVNCITLDDYFAKLNLNNLSLIKIDAEGAELDILLGGEKLIFKYRPFITLEVHPKSFNNRLKSLTDIFELVSEYKYAVYKEKQLLTLNEFCNHDTYFEVLLIPKY